MKDQFYLHFPTMPKGTSQQKRFNHSTGAVFKDKKLQNAETEFKLALLPYRPAIPCTRPIKLIVWFAFDTKNKKLWGKPVNGEKLYEYKATRPDTDNYIKLFKDVMVKTGFFSDDSIIVDEHIIKTYAEKATIMVSYQELYGKFNLHEFLKTEEPKPKIPTSLNDEERYHELLERYKEE